MNMLHLADNDNDDDDDDDNDDDVDDNDDDDDDENSLIQREQRGRDEQLWDYLEATQHVC